MWRIEGEKTALTNKLSLSSDPSDEELLLLLLFWNASFLGVVVMVTSGGPLAPLGCLGLGDLGGLHCVLICEDTAKQLAVPLWETVKQEREPSLGPPSLSPGSFVLPLSTTCLTGSLTQPLSWPRNINLVPFCWLV